MKTPPPITPLEFEEKDFDKAEKLASALGYEQTAYTSTSALWGLFCLPENPANHSGQVTRGGCIIKTKQFGLMFVQDTEDITREVDLSTGWRRISDAPQDHSLWTRDDENGKPIYQCTLEPPKPTEGGYYNAESAVKVKGFNQ